MDQSRVSLDRTGRDHRWFSYYAKDRRSKSYGFLASLLGFLTKSFKGKNIETYQGNW
jgi:hypothetical protein